MEQSWDADVTELDECRGRLDDVGRRLLELVLRADDERRQARDYSVTSSQSRDRVTSSRDVVATDLSNRLIVDIFISSYNHRVMSRNYSAPITL